MNGFDLQRPVAGHRAARILEAHILIPHLSCEGLDAL